MKKIIAAVLIVVMSVVSVSAFAEGEKIENCAKIKESLVNLQHADARARGYLGRYYETILNNFIVPLNMRLVENNISDADLVANQGDYKAQLQSFRDDFITYQQGLEELVSINCEEEPAKFIEKLGDTRTKQQTVVNDVTAIRRTITKQVEYVKKLKERLK